MMKFVLLLSLLLFVFIVEGGGSILDRAQPKGDSTPTTAKPTDSKATTTLKPTKSETTSDSQGTTTTLKETTTSKEDKTTTTSRDTTTSKEDKTTTTSKEGTTTSKEDKTTTSKDGTTTSKGEKTTTSKDDHGDEKCENLEVCTQYSRCAEILSTGDECEGTCSRCIDVGSYGSCEYFRNKKGDSLTIQCYGDSVIETVPYCRSKTCDKYSSPDTCLDKKYCAWVEEGDQCIGDFCGHCIYTHVGCEKHKECYDRTDGRKTRIHRCSVDDVQYSSCGDIERPPCANCKDLSYDKCVEYDGCAWVDVANYYDDDNCPNHCGYCKPTCEYGGNNTCAQAQWYYECVKSFEDDDSSGEDNSGSGSSGSGGDSGSSGSGGDSGSSGSGSDGSGTDETEDGENEGSSDGGSSKSDRNVYCKGDEEPTNVGRCFVKDYLVEDTTDKKRCEDLPYEECINAAANDTAGGCAFVVTSNCGRACGRCVSIGISCPDYKKCHDSSSGEGSQTETYYCDFDETPAATDCVQKYCTAKDAESCLGESDQCVWYQFKSLDYRCGWCSFVCDSCEKEQKRVANAYGSSEFFNGGKYDVICKKDDEKLIKDCYKCYGKKSQCANAFCLDQLKTCNADKTCSDRAFKVMCMEFGEQDGSIFYEKLVKEDKDKSGEGKSETETNGETSEGSGQEGEDDGITDNEAILNFGQCMKNACFEDNDEEIVEEFNSQTSLEPVCSFGYAELDYAIDLCLDSTSIADLCKENYARNFKDVIETDEEAKIYWRYLDTGCNVFFQSSRRMIEETTQVDTEDVTDPWNRITESTEAPEDVPKSENCLSIEVSITYPTKESYQKDKDKYATIDKKINKLKSDASVLISSWTIECCKEDDVCKNMEGSSIAVSTLFAIIAAVATLLFV